MNRKDFICQIGAGITIAAFASFIESCTKSASSDPNVDLTIDLTDVSNQALNQSGGSLYVNNGNIIVVNLGNGKYAAVSSVCTHLGCLVSFYRQGAEFICPCHGSQFATNGNVIAGPATKALEQYNVTVNGTMIRITG